MNQIALDFIKEHEGCSLTAVWDVNGWACGYGSHGPDVHEGTVWSQEQATARLAQDVARFEAAVDNVVKVPITENQQAALISFAYNLGIFALAGDPKHGTPPSTLLRLLNAGDKLGAASQFIRWIHVGNKEVPGLIKRRHDEADLFLA
jgi:lysozyme